MPVSSGMFAWYLYAVMAWSPGPLLPEEQKTLVFGFNHGSECISLAVQVAEQTKVSNAPFRFKQLQCLPCKELYEDKLNACPKEVVVRKR